MKRVFYVVLAAAAAAVLGLSASQQTDIGDLLPVQTLLVGFENGRYVLNGGEGLEGTGLSWTQAMDDLEAGAAGTVFFGATGHVVFDRAAARALPDAMGDDRLRPAARLYLSVGEAEPEEATAFLDAHPGGKTIGKLTADLAEGRKAALPLLLCGEGRYRFAHE